MKLFKIYNPYILLVGVITFFYTSYIFSFSPSFYNDDALFLKNGILNFSVIDFSPHFPGYVSLILIAKFINIFVNDAKESLFILTALSATFLPLVLFLYVKKLSDETSAFFVFLLSISSPYLLNISLSMLSESVGLLFFFLALYLMELKRYKLVGIVLAISFFARSAYLVLFLVGLIYIWFYKRESFKGILFSFILTSFIFLIYIFESNGILYLKEAERFLEGHFSIWGSGQNSSISWKSQFFQLANIAYLFLVFILFRINRNFLLLYALFIAYLLWILYAQNPDNLRHLLPLVLLANIFLAYIFKNQKIIIGLIVIFNIYIGALYHARISPIDQIILELKDSNRVVLSNRSIEILRENLDMPVLDSYYLHSLEFYRSNYKTCLISTIKPKESSFNLYEPRFIGEKSFYLSCDANSTQQINTEI